MNEIYERSPTRVDLAGGTLDCWPLYLFLDEPITINVAIDIFTHCHLRPRDDRSVEIHSVDLGYRKNFRDLQECLDCQDPELALFQAHLRWWKPTQGFSLETRSESPVGGGLGGSSSLCISMLKAFSRWLGRELEPLEMVRIASHLEAQILLKPTGTQDYFPPIFGGLNFIRYGVEGPQVAVKDLPRDLFRRHFLLIYTGKSHHSGINNWQVIKNWLDGDQRTRAALEKLALISGETAQVILASDWGRLPALFEQEYEARTELSEGFSSPEIRRLQQIASQVQSTVKICGAGGGGCVMIWCAEGQVDHVRSLCEREGFQVLNAQPWEEMNA